MTFRLKKAEDLFYQPLEQEKSKMIVEDLIPQGLTLLAGAPKSCKSWMMLDMCLAVSSGEPFLGKETRKCEVLYFSLEDREVRLQSRLLELGKVPPPGMHFCLERKSLEEGFISDLVDTLNEHPDIRLVIIDTLQKIRGDANGVSTANQYSKDDYDISRIKRFADRHNIAIVCVHHLRKMQDKRDPVNEILGSTAMSGVPDQILLLKKDRFRTDGELSAVGRDSPQWKMILKFDEFRWHLIKVETEEELAKEEVPGVLYTIADMVKTVGTWTGTATGLLEAVGNTEMQPNVLSARMTKFYYDVFYPENISMTSKRTANERLLTLTYTPQESMASESASSDVASIGDVSPPVYS